ncbi:NYN domain-containing protein [Patescibacteria group bacterium]|nr:NYN domain-containing protein [Patescibacteria group bacterium]
MKTILLIDGENFKNYIKHSLDTEKRDIIWNEYNFKSLFDLVLEGYDVIKVIFYFAKLKKHEETEKKSFKLIEDQRFLKTHLEKQGFEVVFAGRVRGYKEKGFLGKKILVFKEKGVDVRIGVDMVSFSCDKLFDQIILCSSDSDLQPAISESKKRGSKIIYLGFENNPNRGISYNSNKTILIRNSEVEKFLSLQPELNLESETKSSI